MSHATWKKRGQRLLSMSPDELKERLRQQLVARYDLWLFLVGMRPWERKQYIETGVARARFFFSEESVPALCALLRDRLPLQVEEIIEKAEQACRHRFDLLGYRDVDYGEEIDWHCDRIHE